MGVMVSIYVCVLAANGHLVGVQQRRNIFAVEMVVEILLTMEFGWLGSHYKPRIVDEGGCSDGVEQNSNFEFKF